MSSPRHPCLFESTANEAITTMLFKKTKAASVCRPLQQQRMLMCGTAVAEMRTTRLPFVSPC